MKKLILIDSNALVHRAFHALPPSLSSQKGVITNAVFGFTSVLMKMFKDLRPDYVIATFDLAGKTFRHEEFADYKIHREKAPDELYAQIPLIKKIVSAFGVPIFEKEGFEADDVIGALAEQAKTNHSKDGLQTIIVTGDLDTLQLVDKDKVSVFTLRKGITDTVIYNEKEVKARYGLMPNQVVDFKGLKGDPSDNIPGVPGVGDKTASALIKEFGSIEKMYQELEKPVSKKGRIKKTAVSEKLKEKLLTNKEMALFSKKLATIRRDVPIKLDIADADWKKGINIEALRALFKEYGFFSLSKRLLELVADDLDKLPLPTTVNPETKITSSESEIIGSLKALSESRKFTFDIVDGAFVFTTNGKDVTKIDLGDLRVGKSGPKPWQIFCSILSNDSTKKSGYDLKLAVKKFLEKDIELKGLSFDVKLAAWLLNPDLRDLSLERIYAGEFERDLESGSGGRVLAIFELESRLAQRIKDRELSGILNDIEMPLIPVLAKMEAAGVKINTDSLVKLSKAATSEITQLESQIYKQSGVNFNINSPAQLSEILFTKLGIKGKVKKTSKGAISTAAGELEKLVDVHPIIDMILRYREVQKIKTTYIDPFPKLINTETGRIHTTFNQTGAATGRLSSQDPNLQNIPVRTELGQEFRRAFVARPGYKLLSFDYTQLELRIAAHISDDPKMITAFKRGEDIHTRTAAEIFNVKPEAVTPNMRRQAKALNFGLIYGMGVLGFQRASGVDREKARSFIDAYMTEFAGVARYMRDTKIQAKRDGYVETILGRKRLLPEIQSGIPMLVAQAERISINMPIQGTAADLVKLAMIRIFNEIKKEKKEEDIRMLIQVHDELLFEVKNNLVEDFVKETTPIMEEVYKLKVPLTVDAKVGDNWQDMEFI